MGTFTDRELVMQAQQDPVAGFRQIYDKYWDPLFNTAFRRLQDAAEAQDIVQEVFVTVWDQLQQLEPRDSLLPYLQVILKNRILNLYARNEVKLRYLLQAQWNEAFAHNNTQQQVSLKELQQQIEQAISALPPRMQQIFRLSREEHLSPAEIAGQLSLSVQTVKNQLHRATEKVKQELSMHITPTLLMIALPIITGR